MAYLIGVDVGTTGAKTLLVDEKGQKIASALVEYPLATPRPKWSEQNPEDWVQATFQTIRQVLTQSGVDPAEVKGIGLSGQMHGLVLLDAEKRVLRPAILWNDVRTTEQCRQITEQVGRKTLIAETCNPALEGFTAPKILWVRQHEPEVYQKARWVLLPKDYVRYRLTGEIAMEVSDAAGTLLFNVRERRWSSVVLERLEIPKEWMPPVYESVDICGRITSQVAKATGLQAGTPVVGGGADNACSAVGNGIVYEGRVSASLGTSGVVLAHTDSVLVDPGLRAHTFCHAVPNKWYTMGVMLSAGGAFRWFRDVLGEAEIAEARRQGRDPYELLTERAARAPVGSEGLIFLPYLTGERTPHADANARAVYFGLTLRHNKDAIVRATMEGITYGMRDSLEIIRELGVQVHAITATGGGARSSLWRQIQADVYNVPVRTISQEEGPAFGAAILAGVGAGVFESCEAAADALVHYSSETRPDPERVAIYDAYYQVYRALYPALKPQFDAVSELVERFHSGA
ncbi:MAG: xylulokinase [Candidatus Poribacteria bacterium]|nr:MAG: xylulokinase [Candidatus Poribacteria bacterium]